MSGIAGIIHFDGQPVEPGLIEKMTGAMAHRGPDGINHWVKGSVALGQCMLRTTPESLEEHQPLTNEDESLVLVMDGRVDNWEELRRELLGRGAVLRTRADAELVLRAYEIWGEECPDRIIGEYVFFVWDARQRCLFGARDAAGTRHFYYHAGSGWFGFASEIKGLLAIKRIEPRLNEYRLLDYLVTQFDRDDEVGTFYQNINRMPAGHAMSVTKHGARIWRYWNPGDLPVHTFKSLDECAEAFQNQLRAAVKCRLRSIGSVGSTLSGGLDSSSIVGLISKEFKDYFAQPLLTFSLVRQDRENCLDWLCINEIVKTNNWILPTIISSDIPTDACQSYFDGIHNFDEPFAFTTGFYASLLSRAAGEKGCRILLEGNAGDMLFYDPERSLDIIVAKNMFFWIPTMLSAYHKHFEKRKWQVLAWKLLRKTAPKWVRNVYSKNQRNKLMTGLNKSPIWGDLSQFLKPDIAKQYRSERLARRALNQVKAGTDQSNHARRFTTGVLPFAHEVGGEIAFSNGVELRSPFSDRRMIEFAIQMPLEAKLCSPWYKYLLRKNMLGTLPENVLWRRRIAVHPGMKFFDHFSLTVARIYPDTINAKNIADAGLNRWIDSSRLYQAASEYGRCPSDVGNYNLIVLIVLNQWLSKRALSVFGNV